MRKDFFIPFEIAAYDDKLLGRRFKEFSPAQRTVLKAFYGLDLTEEERGYWALFHGHGELDELGYLTQAQPEAAPYTPKEYHQLWANLGRRAGKTGEIGAFIFAYEMTCGGHLQYARDGQPVISVLVSHRKDIAEQNLQFVRLVLRSSPLLSRLVVDGAPKDQVQLETGLTLYASSPNLGAQRGLACPVVGMDEVAFWYKEADSANPDFEVENAIRPTQLQFPRAKRFGISSPWVMDGLLWRYHQAGTEGCKLVPGADRTPYQDILYLQAPTAAMGNPHVSRADLARERAQMGPEAFEREYLARFTTAISAFLPTPLLQRAVTPRVAEREPLPRPGQADDPTPVYVAAIDPAFRYDAFGVCIAHHERGRGVVIDALRRFLPTPGDRLNPAAVFAELQPLFQAYRIKVVHSDQYQLEALQQLAQSFGFYIQGTDFTSASKGKIWGNFQQQLNQDRLHLLDPQTGGAPAEAFKELQQLERVLRANGGVTIAAPPGKHDDMATVIALATYHATWMLPQAAVADDLPEEHRVQTLFQRAQATIAARGAAQTHGLYTLWD